MKYHDNTITFALNSAYTLLGGSYTIDSDSIPSGQDPDGHIHTGSPPYNFNSNGQITFQVGQDSSSDTANWFNSNAPASQNTFDHTAGSLYFAFMGTLQITITGGILAGRQDTFTFSNVALAMGNDWGAKNWWFGGRNCSYIGNNQVNCIGTDSKGNQVVFVFQRGDNGDSTVGINPSVLIETANWMNRVSDSVQLDQLVLPGSHDAGMSTLSHCDPFVGVQPFTQTQEGNIGQQLANGSRYFDIRVDYDHDQLVTYHRTGPLGCNGQDLQSIFDQTTSFLATNPSETIIFKFSHIRDDDGHDASTIKQQLNTFLNGYSSIMYTNSQSDVNLANLSLGELRGKAIMVFDYSDYINTSTGRFRYIDGDGTSTQPGANITVFDQYSDTATYSAMENDQLTKLPKYAVLGAGRFFLLSWTLTSTAPPLTPPIKDLAREADDNLLPVLYSQIVIDKANKPNIVYLHFINNPLVQGVVFYNL